LKRFHYLYRRTSSDLANIRTFSAERDLRQYLESLVGRAFSEIHEIREKPHRLTPVKWFFHTFPQTFRRHILAFWLSVLVTLTGFAFGGAAIGLDRSAKEILMPFSHLQMDPSERVAKEEGVKKDRLENQKATFSSFLMTHNIKVSIATMALGITWGIGTIILLFTNGVMIGAVALDYILAGETKFLLGWLLPHGSIEIPAIVIAGQAGLLLAGALIGWGKPVSLRERMRAVAGDIVALIFGVAVMLVWAGIVEAFLSQYHAPVISYNYKIGLGIIELGLLVLFLMKSGKSKT
jgi:uncharacterized membrane protein SpoIIM required for sporulation